MWFKQAQLLKLKNLITYQPELLATQLQPFVFHSCLANLPISQGWVSPMDEEGAPLIHAACDYMLICLQIEEKILPASVIRHKTKEEVKKIESSREQKVNNKEKYELRQRIYNDLLPKAFSKISRIYAYFDTKNNWLIINTLNAKKTEIFTSFLKKSLEAGQQLYYPELQKLSSVMGNWLQNNTHPDTLEIEKASVFRDPGNKSRTIHVQQQDLFAQTIQSLLKDQLEVSQMEFTWQDQVTFTLKENFSLQSIKYQDSVLNLGEEETQVENKAERFAADFVIMTNILSQLFSELLNVLQKDKS